MRVSPARTAAFEILLRGERDRAYASELLHSSGLSTLSVRDHGLATELVMGVLRWRSVVDEQLASASAQKLARLDPEVLTTLRIGAYQLLFLSRVPSRAAIFESVEIVKKARKRSAAAFVNAVLRKISTRAPVDAMVEIEKGADEAALAKTAAHPEWLVARWIARYGRDIARQICIYDQTVPSAAIHVPDERAVENLQRKSISLSPGLLVSSARRVSSSDAVHARALTQGQISIQDEASQLVALLVGRGGKILDCCAAPGGKTSLIAERNPGAKVYACDLYPHRARLLRRLTQRQNVQIAAADALALPFTARFDRILADVPCSGTGTLAHNPEIKWRLTPDDLLDLQARQMAILKSALAALSGGGRLVYSTCSLEPEENEMVVKSVLDGTDDFRLIDCRGSLEDLQRAGELSWNDVNSLVSGPYLRTIPGVHPCDGFFAAILERKG